ncbi:MAG TPA: carbohydrate kinase family protein [Anaerolineaceae bacterium]|nr:carbohydrate kinase family protein [Anaerolineaceae bacterium]
MALSKFDILNFGDYFCDLIITGLKEIPRLGADIFGNSMEIIPGGAYNLTTALHRLGVKVGWAPRLGNDLFSRFVLEQAVREGLDTSLFQVYDMPLRSLSVSFSFSQDRGFISYMDPFPELPYEALIDSQQPLWVVDLPFHGSPDVLRLVDRVHQHGGKVFADCQYITSTLETPGLTDLLEAIDIFAPNQSEAYQLTGMDNPEASGAKLAQYCPLVVIKCGDQGAYAFSGSQVWHSPALPMEVVDSTGAGDSFNAGFLAAVLQNQPIETCLRYGNICGGLSVTQRGGTAAAPTMDQLKTYL